MSTLKVNTIEPYSGGTVTITGGTIASASYAVTASFALNAGGGSDLSSYTGSINQTGGTTNLNGTLTVQGGNISLPYDGTQRNMQVGLSGSLNYNVGGFDFGGKSYGQIYSNADGGFQIVDAAPTGTFPSVTLQSDNGNINLRTQTTGSLGGITNTIVGNGSFKAINNTTQLQVYAAGGGTGVGIGVTPRSGGPGVPFGGNIDSTYGLNIYNTDTFNQDTGMALNLDAAAGTGTNKIGIFSNFGAAYEDIMSWEDANNYTDGALQVHQILKVDGTNNAPGATLDVKDGAGTPRLQVQNAALKAITGIDVVINGDTQIANGLTLPGIGDYADDAAAATGGVPLNGVYQNRKRFKNKNSIKL
jgi:hypothetical protein